MSIEKTIEKFIKKSVAIYGDRFNYENIRMVERGVATGILCKEHQKEFSCSIYDHLRNTVQTGCSECKRGNKKQKFLDAAKKRRGNNYDFSKMVYVDALTPIVITCKIHGIDFTASPNQFVFSGITCPKCRMEKNLSAFIDKAREAHGHLYDYSLITDYKSDIKLPIVCKEHGTFWQLPHSHLNCINPCPECAGRLGRTRDEFIQKSKEVHGDIYDYSKVEYRNMRTVVTIICKIHGPFQQTPVNHVQGRCGCKSCSNNYGSSKVETEWLNSLRVPVRGIKVEGVVVDGYDDGADTVYEFLGDYWHGNPARYPSEEINPSNKTAFGELCKLTFERLESLKRAGHKVVYIWESDWNAGKEPVQL